MESPSVTAEAASAPAPMSASDKAADFENFLFDGEEEEEQDSPEADSDDEPELEAEGEEQDGQDDEPETAIDAPPSLNAEEKAVFAQLPTEAQQAWAASETRRNTQVQEATTKAAAKEREAQTALDRADAVAGAHYAAQLKAFAEAFRPQMPDPQLAYVDPQRYIAEKAQYDAMQAQFDQLEQHVSGIRDQSQAKAQQVDQAARAADLLTHDKLRDPATRDDYVKSSLSLVQELGLDAHNFEQVAGSEDFRALDKIADWKAKAAKYDAAMSRQMQKVRSGKTRTMRPGATPTDNPRAAQDKSWQRVQGAKSKHEQAEAFADYLGL